MINNENIEKILGRKEKQDLLDIKNDIFFKNKKFLITGANGSIGTELRKTFEEMEVDYLATDIDGNLEYLDITDLSDCINHINKFRPDFIINIAGLKYATKSEHQAWKTVQVNIKGVKNLIDASHEKCRVILTSTCKSANPEIVYGATKLIAERMIINSGGSVARFFNVVESQGNVFEIWSKIDKSEPIKVVSECNRYFISVKESVGLILHSIKNKGRFVVNVNKIRNMQDVAEDLYPDREKQNLNRRRGDRKNEIFLSTSEKDTVEDLNGSVLKIFGDHDKNLNYTE
jgi:FlaA1/EpsC-like NDP-sugar epimerase